MKIVGRILIILAVLAVQFLLARRWVFYEEG